MAPALTRKGTRTRVNLGFKYDEKRYENKKFIPEKDAVANKPPMAAPAPVPGQKKKPRLNLPFKYEAERYEDKSFIPDKNKNQ